KILTDAFIAKLTPPASGRIEIADLRCSGLAIRVTSNGAKSWSFRYRARGASAVSRLTLGSYPEIGLSRARKQANDMRGIVAEGGNPVVERREQRSGNRTFA